MSARERMARARARAWAVVRWAGRRTAAAWAGSRAARRVLLLWALIVGAPLGMLWHGIATFSEPVAWIVVGGLLWFDYYAKPRRGQAREAGERGRRA